jgi:MYXO-CTERM domain-containing protein
MVGVANLGEPDLNAEGKHDRAAFTLSFERVLDTPEDSDPLAADDSGSQAKETPAACGCSSVQPSGLAGLGLIGLLGLPLRRRR